MITSTFPVMFADLIGIHLPNIPWFLIPILVPLVLFLGYTLFVALVSIFPEKPRYK